MKLLLTIIALLSFTVTTTSYALTKSRLQCDQINLDGMWQVQFYNDSVESARLALWIDDEVPVPMSDYFTDKVFGLKIKKEGDKLRVYSNIHDEKSGAEVYMSVGDNIRRSKETGETYCSLEIKGHTVKDGQKIKINEYLFILASSNGYNQFWIGGKDSYAFESFSIDQSMSAMANLKRVQLPKFR